MGFSWKAGAAVALAGGVIALGGCVEFEGPIKGKQISEDEVKIGFRICDDRSADCNPQPMERRRGESESETRVLIAIRAPKGTGMPQQFKPRKLDVSFSESRSYSKELDAKAIHKGGERWYGYVSGDISGMDATEAKFKLTLGLPKNPGKFFKFRPVVGYVNGGPADKVLCSDDPREPFSDGDTDFVCIDDPETNKELRKNIKVELG